MEMGLREYARHRGVSLGAVQKAIKSGRIQQMENGKIDQGAADIAWQANTDATRVALNALPSQSPPLMQAQFPLAPAPASEPAAATAATSADASDEVTGKDRVADEYREHRATRERYNALTQQLEYEQLVGSLIAVDEAKRLAYTAFRGLRDAVMNVPARLKDQLAALSDPHEVEQLLEAELTAALGGLDVSKLLRDQDE